MKQKSFRKNVIEKTYFFKQLEFFLFYDTFILIFQKGIEVFESFI